jgi:peptide/nickel transport system substrate-binding protein
MSVPWSVDELDPHDATSAIAALFAPAAFDTLFAATDAGVPYPALASAMPARDGAGCILELRPGVRTAAGAPIFAHDVVTSFQRAASRGAAPLLGPFAEPRSVQGKPFSVAFRKAEPTALARALSSPLTAIVPRSFDPRAPDGTGAFAAKIRGGTLELSRNERAARGPAYLDRVIVKASADLRAGLRAFETGGDDVGWLGSGLFGARSDATSFDLGAVALVVLAVGESLGAHAKPGGAQALCDGIPRDRIAHLGLGDLPRGEPRATWTGSPVDLCVEAGAPQLVEVARSLAAALTTPGHEVEPKIVPRKEAIQRGKRDALALFVVRPFGPGSDATRAALTAVEDPARAREILAKASTSRAGSPRNATGTLRVGVLGELRVAGAIVKPVVLARSPSGGWDLGATYRRRS